MNLTEIQRDTMLELVNIGVGRAAVALSEMVGDQVHLSVPEIDVFSRSDICERFAIGDRALISSVSQRFDGPFRGNAILVFPEARSLELVRALLGEDVPLEQLTELEQEALLEVGNVVLNASLGILTNTLSIPMKIDLPVFRRSTAENIFCDEDDSQHDLIMILRIEFETGRSMVRGYIALALEGGSVTRFLEHITMFLNRVAA